MPKMSAKKIEDIVNKLYRRHAHGMEFNIFDLSKVLSAPRELLRAGFNETHAEQALIDAINQYGRLIKYSHNQNNPGETKGE